MLGRAFKTAFVMIVGTTVVAAMSPTATLGAAPQADAVGGPSGRPDGVAVLAAAPDAVVNLAPRLKLHPYEYAFPMSAITFVERARLRWAHDSSCNDWEATEYGGIDINRIDNDYFHAATNDVCDHETFNWGSSAPTRPLSDGGPSGAEGFFMQLQDQYEDGEGFAGTEPVYVQFNPSDYILYWFHYGSSYYLDYRAHEGDWERIAIRLDNDNHGVEVWYHYHTNSCTLSWSDAPKFNGHPTVWVARGAHGSYPPGADTFFGDKISGASNRTWEAKDNLDMVTDTAWYPYGGAWGEIGTTSDTTGPMGPHPSRYAPNFDAGRCDMNP